FSFQAEDGIRDRNVTGVQTCALPISGGAVFHGGSSFFGGVQGAPPATGGTGAARKRSCLHITASAPKLQCPPAAGGKTPGSAQRSEERRVGKGYRCLSARYDERQQEE